VSEHSIEKFSEEILTSLKQAGKDFTAHSIFSPSGSSMWAYCSGSLIPNLYESDNSGAEAAEGTVAHGVAERWLKDCIERNLPASACRPDHLIGTTEIIGEFAIEITLDMLEHLYGYVEWCNVLPGVHFVETKVDFSDLTPIKRQRGTADHAACMPRKLTVSDLKYGTGVQVYARENSQAIIYGYGFFRLHDDLFDFEEIEIRIGQPRLNHYDSWTITRDELLEWAKWIKDRAYAAWCHNAARTPSLKACQWCKIKSSCAAHAVFIERLTDGIFENLDAEIGADDMNMLMDKLEDGTFELRPISVGLLTLEQKVKVTRYASMVKSWFDSITAELDKLALAGRTIPGKKVVEGRSNRMFPDIDNATNHLEFLGLEYDTIRPRAMIGITEVEAQLLKVGYKRKQLEDLLKPVVRKPAGKPTVVDEDDPRPAMVHPTDDAFDNLDEEL
jgi:hypothetical protein